MLLRRLPPFFSSTLLIRGCKQSSVSVPRTEALITGTAVFIPQQISTSRLLEVSEWKTADSITTRYKITFQILHSQCSAVVKMSFQTLVSLTIQLVHSRLGSLYLALLTSLHLVDSNVHHCLQCTSAQYWAKPLHWVELEHLKPLITWNLLWSWFIFFFPLWCAILYAYRYA